MSTEEKMVVRLSRPGRSKRSVRDSERVWDEASRPVDYDELLRLAVMNGVPPLVYRNLKGLPGIPEGVMSGLKPFYYQAVSRNIHYARETLRIIALLRKEGIEAIPLKGALASDMVFGDIGLYPGEDIDILVRPSDLERTKEILRDAGYTGGGETHEKDLTMGHYHLVLHNGTYTVEVHWNLVKRYFTVPPDFWWEDTMRVPYEGTEITLLSHERYLLCAIFRLFDHGFRPLKFFVLIAALINAYGPAVDWEMFLSHAAKCKMGRLTMFTLRLIRDLLGTEVPEPVLKRKVLGHDFMAKVVVSGLFRGETRAHLRMFLYTFLLDTTLDTAKVAVRRIFPEEAEIRLRYGLSGSSRMVYAYYLLNPLLLFLRRR